MQTALAEISNTDWLSFRARVNRPKTNSELGNATLRSNLVQKLSLIHISLGIGFTYNVPKLFKRDALLGRAVDGFLLSGVYRYRSGQVYTPYQPLTLDGNTGDASFCDGAFNADVIGVDTCRLVLSNTKATFNTIAYLNPYVNSSTPYSPVPGTPAYVIYGSDSFDSNGNYIQGTPVNPASTHWIVNNKAYALAVSYTHLDVYKRQRWVSPTSVRSQAT